MKGGSSCHDIDEWWVEVEVETEAESEAEADTRRRRGFQSDWADLVGISVMRNFVLRILGSS